MGRLDDIEKRMNDRFSEIDRRLQEREKEIDQRIFGSVGGESDSVRQPPPSARGGSSGGGVRSALSMAPLSKEFVEWARGSSRSVSSSFGLVPTPYDFGYLGRLAAARRGCRPVSNLPESFDLRTHRALMPIRNQGVYGTCWAHASLASIESCLLKSGVGSVDLSENNLANLSGFDNGFSDGGNHNMSSAYLLRWDGPVEEKNDPYGRPGASRNFPPAWHVQSIRWAMPMQDASDTRSLKETVYSCGAVYVGYIHTNDPSAYRSDTAAYCLSGKPPSDAGGHAVAVVGWNDAYPASNFATPPPGDGAWIVRNSWGTDWGDAGYFYVSYHDLSFGRMTPGCAFCGVERTDNYDDVLQYDRLGLVTATGVGESSAAANMFIAPRDLTVEAVGFYMLSPGTSYKVGIVTGCQPGDPDSGTPMGVTGGSSEWPGYDTVHLSSPVSVRAGDIFAVRVELNSPGIDCPVGVEVAFPKLGTSKAESDPGQSFVLDPNSGWIDMTTLDRTANFCCKAYVKYTSGGDRSHKMFCKACGKYSYVESYGNNKCPHCGAWLD